MRSPRPSRGSTFQAAQNFNVGSAPVGITSRDFNGDGKPDLAVTNAGSNNVSVLLNTTPFPPVAKDDSYSTNENQTLNEPATTGVLKNDKDPNGQALTASEVSGPTHGTLTLNSDGSFTYTPNSGFTGKDTFTYKDSDATGLSSNTATVTITVNPVNGPPPPHHHKKKGHHHKKKGHHHKKKGHHRSGGGGSSGGGISQ